MVGKMTPGRVFLYKKLNLMKEGMCLFSVWLNVETLSDFILNDLHTMVVTEGDLPRKLSPL